VEKSAWFKKGMKKVTLEQAETIRLKTGTNNNQYFETD
jgi:hypothetical protein